MSTGAGLLDRLDDGAGALVVGGVLVDEPVGVTETGGVLEFAGCGEGGVVDWDGVGPAGAGGEPWDGNVLGLAGGVDGEGEAADGLAAAVLDDEVHETLAGAVVLAGDGGVDVLLIVVVHGPAEVDGAVAEAWVATGSAGVGGVLGEEVGGVLGGEAGDLGHECGDGACDERGGTGGAVEGDEFIAWPCGLEFEAWGGDPEVLAGVGEGGLLAEGVDGSDGDDAGVGGRPCEGGGGVVAAGCGDDCAFLVGVGDHVGEDGGVFVGSEADIDDLGTGVDGGFDALGESEDIADPVCAGDADGEDVGGGSGAGAAGGGTCGEGGDGGAVAIDFAGAAEALTDVDGAEAVAESAEGIDPAVEDGDGDAFAP